MTKSPPTLHAKLKQCEPEVQEYVRALKSENAKLQRRVAKLESDKISLHNRIKGLEKQLKENRPVVHYSVNLQAKP